MNVTPLLQIQVQVAIASPFSFPAFRVRHPRLAHTAESRNDCAAFRLFLQLVLDRFQEIISGVSCRAVELPRERCGQTTSMWAMF